MRWSLSSALAWLTDRSVPIAHKLVGLFALIYVASPIDLVPDFIPIIGWLDDAGAIALVAAHYVRRIREHHLRTTKA
jgi:uncharacterized membrane protein YkvA (DUF1232 family)